MAWSARRTAIMEGFNYSEGTEGQAGPWTYDELNEWLYKPSAYAPGTRMAFAGITSDKQRADVIAYLRTLSDNPEPLPSPEAAPQAATTGCGARRACQTVRPALGSTCSRSPTSIG